MSEQLLQMQSIGMMVAGVHRKPRKFKVAANQFYPWRIERKAAQWLGKFFEEAGNRYAKEELSAQGIALDEELFGNIDPNGSDESLENFANELFNQTQKYSTIVHQNFFVKLKIQNMGAAGASDLKNDFVERFVTNCKTTTEQQKRDIGNAIYNFKTSRGNQIPLDKQIQAINANYSDSKAKFIARNEVANLNELISRTQAEESGFSCYEWLATNDMATRDSHAALNGMICRYDDSSVYSDDGGKTWKKRTSGMYHGEPGTDYNCRCCGAPYDRDLYQEEKEPTEKEKIEEKKGEEEVVEKMYSKAESISSNFKNNAKEYEEQVIEETKKEFEERQKKVEKYFTDKPIECAEDIQKVLNIFFADHEEYFGQKERKKFGKAPTITFKELSTDTLMACGKHNDIDVTTKTIKNAFQGKSVSETLTNAFENIRKGKNLSFDEEYAFCTLYHENLHNKSKNYGRIDDPNGTYTELIVEFLARREYKEMLSKLGGKATHCEQIIKKGYSYKVSVTNLIMFINKAGGIDEKTLNNWKESLLNLKEHNLFDNVFNFIESKLDKFPKLKNESLIKRTSVLSLMLDNDQFIDFL